MKHFIFQFLVPLYFLIPAIHLIGQEPERPSFNAGVLSGDFKLDGVLDEYDWNTAPILEDLRTTVPVEKGTPSASTKIQVLANARNLLIGIQCMDPTPDGIVRFSKLRDADISEEDHVKVVIDPFLDGQSGYIFAVNAFGARYDALVSDRGEEENEDWDAVWDARAVIHEDGWSVEIIIPIQSISYRKGLDRWGFNVERRIQRNQETIRWANVQRDQWFIQTSRAGLLTNLPEFSFGLGLNVRPSLVTEINKFGPGGSADFDFDAALDASQRIGPNVLATITVNTDFAETEVDTRQTNLTRFPLFFP